MGSEKLKIAFIHPDLGIGGAERLVVDAALGLQHLGHDIDVYTSHHDRDHCFEETRDGTLRVHYIRSPFPRSINGKFHILFAHLRQLHLVQHLLRTNATSYDVFFVDQLSTCVPFLRHIAGRRVVFYVHFPDKLLVDGEFTGVGVPRRKLGLLKRIYRVPMDWLEEQTTGSADVLLANSNFTASVFNAFFNIPRTPYTIHPGINLSAYAPPADMNDADIQNILSDKPTLLSLNRFERKKNILLALSAFGMLLKRTSKPLRLVLAGGYDPRVEDNRNTLTELVSHASSQGLTYTITSPNPSLLTHITTLNLPQSPNKPQTPQITFLLSFTTPQRAALLTSPSTLALLYTPTNEHFGIVPVEAMVCGLPVLACNSGGPTESVLSSPPCPPSERTGWLAPPDAQLWSQLLEEIVNLDEKDRVMLGERAKKRAREEFGMEAMAEKMQDAIQDAVDMGPVQSPVVDALLAFLISVVAYLLFTFLV